MAEYIEREALKERLELRRRWLALDAHDEYSQGLFHGCETDIELIDEIPAADVVEVKRGRWEQDADGDWFCTHCDEYACICDISGKERTYRKPFCPNCGADMREVRDDGEE